RGYGVAIEHLLPVPITWDDQVVKRIDPAARWCTFRASEVSMAPSGSIRVVPLTAGFADLETGEVRIGGDSHRLTGRELEVFASFAARPGETILRDELLLQVFGQHPATVSRAADTAVYRIRAKIEVDPTDPVHLISVFGEGYRFVPPSRPTRPPNVRVGVPRERTALLGRRPEVQTVLGALGSARVVVLVGPGGVGKSRIATRVAWEAPVERVLFLSLSHATTASELVTALARSAGVTLDRVNGAAQLASELDRFSSTLVVLDNVEQLNGVVSVVQQWIGSTPTVSWLVTSRVAVGIPGETTIRLDCLDSDTAVAMFVERATDVGAVIGPDTVDSVRVLVRRLDHLPLAIELAAARARVMSPAQICARFQEPLRLLSMGVRDDDRRTSLRAALDWSWDLLAPADRDALARLAVFPAPSPRALVIEALGPGGAERLERLIAASLLHEGPNPGWVYLLETVRAWAEIKAEELGVREAAELAHAERYARWLVEELPLDRPVGCGSRSARHTESVSGWVAAVGDAEPCWLRSAGLAPSRTVDRTTGGPGCRQLRRVPSVYHRVLRGRTFVTTTEDAEAHGGVAAAAAAATIAVVRIESGDPVRLAINQTG
ncbi:MAG: winged helix-turn-helix domain-containing protein, partial [Myxococcota bacterium]